MSQLSHPLLSTPQALLCVHFVALMCRKLVAIPALPGPVSSRDLGLHPEHVALFTHTLGLVMYAVALGESWLRATCHIANRDALHLEIASLNRVLDHARGQAFTQIPYTSSTLELRSLTDDNVLYNLAGSLLSNDPPVVETILNDLIELARLPAGWLPDIFEAYRTALVAAVQPGDVRDRPNCPLELPCMVQTDIEGYIEGKGRGEASRNRYSGGSTRGQAKDRGNESASL
ncbi:hypothetical protein K488DRAFT_74989 [Vararia minispora EC-137]|uniref:Uncharacterized protein n=1 Tax=Vararia minispora EC-137 TaxID=1314806 RepID=A0ACB8Q5I3_9AGAM|nr:hypothetical protein K488DRAFT_74989 [Vararia minispora EC-137]